MRSHAKYFCAMIYFQLDLKSLDCNLCAQGAFCPFNSVMSAQEKDSQPASQASEVQLWFTLKPEQLLCSQNKLSLLLLLTGRARKLNLQKKRNSSLFELRLIFSVPVLFPHFYQISMVPIKFIYRHSSFNVPVKSLPLQKLHLSATFLHL